MMAELRASWEANEGLPLMELQRSAGGLLSIFSAELRQSSAHRAAMEKYIQDALSSDPRADSYAWRASAYRLHRAAGRVPKPTMPELAQTLWSPEKLAGFNVFLSLSTADRGRLRKALVLWMELCVLEDKAERLVRMAQAMADLPASASSDAILADIKTELLVTRGWSASEHPE